MSVSDSSAAYDPCPNWPDIRRQYETSAIGHRKLAQLRNVPYSTLSKRAIREHWVQSSRLLRQAAANLEAQLPKKLLEHAEEQLAPWIEAKKTEITREGVNIAEIGLSRIHKMFKAAPKPDPKMESFTAKSAETYHRMARVALGMNDGQGVVTPLTLNLLGNHQAVQIVQSPNDSQV